MQGAVWNPLLLFLFGQIWMMIEKVDELLLSKIRDAISLFPVPVAKFKLYGSIILLQPLSFLQWTGAWKNILRPGIRAGHFP